jgi:hypothetical protein
MYLSGRNDFAEKYFMDIVMFTSWLFNLPQNGFVECEKDSCPATDDCYAIQKNSESCCDKCKGKENTVQSQAVYWISNFSIHPECVYKGEIYQSGAEWFDEDDPCSVFKCVAGVITESITKCYTACSNPLPAAPGQCCPSCLGKHIQISNYVTSISNRLKSVPSAFVYIHARENSWISKNTSELLTYNWHFIRLKINK